MSGITHLLNNEIAINIITGILVIFLIITIIDWFKKRSKFYEFIQSFGVVFAILIALVASYNSNQTAEKTNTALDNMVSLSNKSLGALKEITSGTNDLNVAMDSLNIQTNLVSKSLGNLSGVINKQQKQFQIAVTSLRQNVSSLNGVIEELKISVGSITPQLKQLIAINKGQLDLSIKESSLTPDLKITFGNDTINSWPNGYPLGYTRIYSDTSIFFIIRNIKIINNGSKKAEISSVRLFIPGGKKLRFEGNWSDINTGSPSFGDSLGWNKNIFTIAPNGGFTSVEPVGIYVIKKNLDPTKCILVVEHSEGIVTAMLKLYSEFKNDYYKGYEN